MTAARPLLKWAGGKTQLLPHLLRYVPASYGRYIEPMVGGGALFFAVAPERGVIADSNPELINVYRAIVDDMDHVIARVIAWEWTEPAYYAVRSLRFGDLDPLTAAARTIYLNRAGFNGLYRVNRQGHFNVPWGGERQRFVPDRAAFARARAVLARADIRVGDYADTLRDVARAGDFVFLDPPYVPVSQFADFKRYTATPFGGPDHRAMRDLVGALAERGCQIVVTNSNHASVHDLYRDFAVEVVPTRRNVNADSSGRTGEDVIVYVPRSDRTRLSARTG